MTWAKIDDQFPEHPKIVAVGEEAAWLTVKAICWSSRHLTDGFIPKVVAEHLAQSPGRPAEKAVEMIRKLVRHHLWDRVKDGYRVHDYLNYNPSKKSVLAERARKKRAGVLGAKARWGEGSVAGAKPSAMHPAKALP